MGGGDIYFSHIARAALDAGYDLHFYGGHALKGFLESQGLPLNLTLTDSGLAELGDVTTLGGQVRLLFDFTRRLLGTLRQLGRVRRDDIAYAMSDFWFDSIPLMCCRARFRIMYLGMMAPTLKEVLTKGRADVTTSRLASLYYWASQQFSLRAFSRFRNKLFTYGHPNMRPYLKRFGYGETELAYVANGMEVEVANRVPDQPKQYDLVWTGRVHPQKGIDDLLAALVWLAKHLPGFRAVLIGKSQEQLAPRIGDLGLADCVTFTGLVSEEEKFRVLKASRVFAMPSRYESWGIVVGEALAAGIPVVAYDLDCYRPVFADFVRYVSPFDRGAFTQAVAQEIQAMRASQNYLDKMNLRDLKAALSWQASQEAFRRLLTDLGKERSPAD
jgi:glycosyltransferase involved in cell wall biosynthesis